MSQIVCAHCGELFPKGKLVCPHCGADADFTWAEEPSEFDFGTADPSPEPRPPKRGLCVVCLAGPAISGLVWVLLL